MERNASLKNEGNLEETFQFSQEIQKPDWKDRKKK